MQDPASLPVSPTEPNPWLIGLFSVLAGFAIGTGTALGKEFSNDPGGGPYVMSTDGSGGYARASMATSFGDVAWRLDVGQVGVCAYDPVKSKFGWHIIKRLR